MHQEHLMPKSASAEAAVRTYLEFINGDGGDLGRAKSMVTRATDPMVKLKALSVTARADEVEAAFVENAAAYGEAEDIAVAAWQALGVSDEVLVRAGILPGGRAGRPRKAAAKKAPAKRAAKKAPAKRAGRKKAATRSRSSVLDLDEVIAMLPSDEFRVREFSELIDRPIATARNYLDRLESAKAVSIVRLDRTGRGKPAKIYART
jgi:hypothetical protein